MSAVEALSIENVLVIGMEWKELIGCYEGVGKTHTHTASKSECHFDGPTTPGRT